MNKKSSGQSLIEILIAISVMVIVLIALLSLTVSSLSTTSFAKKQNEATKYSQMLMEQVRNNYLQNNWATFVSQCEAGFSLTVPSRLTENFETPEISCDDSNGGKQVIITISWTDGKGDHQSKIEDYFIPRQQ